MDEDRRNRMRRRDLNCSKRTKEGGEVGSGAGVMGWLAYRERKWSIRMVRASLRDAIAQQAV